MGLFFPQKELREGVRYTGFARYRQVLEGNWKDFLIVGFITLLYFIPFGLGMAWALLSQSLLVMLGASLVGGLFIGPGLACMYDLILRRMRDDLADWSVCYRRAFRQNLRASLLPGVLQTLYLGAVIFSGALQWWGGRFSLGTIALILFASTLVWMIFSVWWPQVVLFDQLAFLQLKNCVLFILMHPLRAGGVALLQVAWWLLAFLLLPWSAFLVPPLSVWYILLLAVFFLYAPLNDDMHIEEQLAQKTAAEEPDTDIID